MYRFCMTAAAVFSLSLAAMADDWTADFLNQIETQIHESKVPADYEGPLTAKVREFFSVEANKTCLLRSEAYRDRLRARFAAYLKRFPKDYDTPTQRARHLAHVADAFQIIFFPDFDLPDAATSEQIESIRKQIIGEVETAYPGVAGHPVFAKFSTQLGDGYVQLSKDPRTPDFKWKLGQAELETLHAEIARIGKTLKKSRFGGSRKQWGDLSDAERSKVRQLPDADAFLSSLEEIYSDSMPEGIAEQLKSVKLPAQEDLADLEKAAHREIIELQKQHTQEK